jgi:hypothetical protein
MPTPPAGFEVPAHRPIDIRDEIRQTWGDGPPDPLSSISGEHAFGTEQVNDVLCPLGSGPGANAQLLHLAKPGITETTMRKQPELALLFVLVAPMPAMGQEVASASKASAAASSPAAIPNFSGFWAHPYNPGLEPPASGPGPVRRVATRGRLIGDYTNPILKPQAAAAVKKHNDTETAGEAAPIPSNQCWPSGVPYIFFQSGMQMLQHSGEVDFLYLRDHEVRHIRMNEPHLAQPMPSWYGDSVGHYEGDTLVIDTVAVKADRPFAMVDMFGTPFSPALHVVERYRLVDYEIAKQALDRAVGHNGRIPEVGVDDNYHGKWLQLQLRIEDDGVFTTPWSASITYGRLSTPWEEHVCSENPHEYYPNGDPKTPVANKPDF